MGTTKLIQGKLFLTSSANKYMLKVNRRNTRESCEVRSKLTIKTPCVFLINFEHVSHFFIVSVVEFEHINVYWEVFMKCIVWNLFCQWFVQIISNKIARSFLFQWKTRKEDEKISFFFDIQSLYWARFPDTLRIVLIKRMRSKKN